VCDGNDMRALQWGQHQDVEEWTGIWAQVGGGVVVSSSERGQE
jgi:hypothetical protein